MEKSARIHLIFRFNYIFIHIQPIRRIDHSFIPLSFHWNTCLNTLISGTCTNLWLFKPAGFTDFSDVSAQETKVFLLNVTGKYSGKIRHPRYFVMDKESKDMPDASPDRSLHL
jgi:hypothetical protein